MHLFLKRALYILYQSFNRGSGKGIAYETALMAATFFVYLHILQFKALIWGGTLIFGDNKYENFFSASAFFIPIFLFFYFFFNKKEIIEMAHDNINLRRGYLLLILYVVSSFSLLMIIALYKE